MQRLLFLVLVACGSSPSPTPSASIGYKGNWDGQVGYKKGEIVTLNGSSYVALEDNTNSAPPGPAWGLLASKGDSGAMGSMGDIGLQGPPGEQGPIGLTGPTPETLWQSDVPSNSMTTNANVILTGPPGQTLLTVNSQMGTTGLLVNGYQRIIGRLTIDSDLTLKQDVATLPGALEKVAQLRGVSFAWKDHAGVRDIGVIAQEVEAVYPEVVTTSDGGVKSVSYTSLIGPLIEAVKELKAENAALRARVEALEAR